MSHNFKLVCDIDLIVENEKTEHLEKTDVECSNRSQIITSVFLMYLRLGKTSDKSKIDSIAAENDRFIGGVQKLDE